RPHGGGASIALRASAAALRTFSLGPWARPRSVSAVSLAPARCAPAPRPRTGNEGAPFGSGKTSGRSEGQERREAPVFLPQAALVQRLERHDGLGVVQVPLLADPLDTQRRRLAHRLRRPAAYLPAHTQELLVPHHLLALADVVQKRH